MLHSYHLQGCNFPRKSWRSTRGRCPEANGDGFLSGQCGQHHLHCGEIPPRHDGYRWSSSFWWELILKSFFIHLGLCYLDHILNGSLKLDGFWDNESVFFLDVFLNKIASFFFSFFFFFPERAGVVTTRGSFLLSAQSIKQFSRS